MRLRVKLTLVGLVLLGGLIAWAASCTNILPQLIASLGARHLHRVVLDVNAPGRLLAHEVYLKDAFGQLREAIMGPDGHLYVTTSNCDSRGQCLQTRDAMLRITGKE